MKYCLALNKTSYAYLLLFITFKKMIILYVEKHTMKCAQAHIITISINGNDFFLEINVKIWFKNCKLLFS